VIPSTIPNIRAMIQSCIKRIYGGENGAAGKPEMPRRVDFSFARAKVRSFWFNLTFTWTIPIH